MLVGAVSNLVVGAVCPCKATIYTIASPGRPTVALATSTYLLMRYPETLKQLTNEIRKSFESGVDITISATMSLPYFAAVINETLRIHHPTPINLPRVVPSEGQMINPRLSGF